MTRWMKLLLGILATLLVTYGITRIPRSSKPGFQPSLPPSPSTLEITGPILSLSLEKSSDTWRLTRPIEAAANPEPLRTLLTALESLSVETLVTRRGETHEHYELDDKKGIQIKVTGLDGKTLSLLVGKTAPDGSRVYIRELGKPEVYLASGLRRYMLDQPLLSWQDRSDTNATRPSR
jgi:hypothetical protein